MKEEIKGVFESLADATIIPNVRDAVRGLSSDSCLIGPVEFYGDRSVVINASVIVLKAPRDKKEARKIAALHSFLRELGLGAKDIFFVPSINGSSSGIVDRISWLSKKNDLIPLKAKKLQFFIDTPEADELTSLLQSEKIGSSAAVSRAINNKVLQREIAALLPEEIFPPHLIAKDEAEAVAAFRRLSIQGAVLAKVGHLASGEGMRVIWSEEEANSFWSSWTPILKSQTLPEKIIFEEKMALASAHNSISVQFFKSGEKLCYLGASIQHIGSDGITHEGNKIGADIRFQLPIWIEEEMIRKSRLLLSAFPKVEGFIGFDFIVCQDDKILMTEVNLRMTASTLLFSLVPQVGSHLSFDLRKIHVGPQPKIGLIDLLKKLRKFNNPERIIIPLNGRLFDESGDMFVVVCAPAFEQIEEARSEVLGWFK
jgi:hypothetical protein